MPELPEVETTVRGLERVLKGRRIARVEARRADLRRALPGRPRPAADRRAGHRARPPRQIWADRHRPRRHAGLPPRHVGAAGGSIRREIGKHDHLHASRPTRGGGWRSTIRGGSARSTWCRPTSSTDWPPFAALGPEPLDLDARELKRRLAGRTRGDQAAAARPADRRRARQYLCLRGAVPRRHPSQARRRLDLARAARAAGRRRSTRCSTKRSRPADRRLRDFASPDGELGYFSKRFAVYDREGQPCALRRDGQAHRPGRPLDLLLPALPALTG